MEWQLILTGALVTLAVQILKKLTSKIGSDWTLVIVVVLTFIGAYLWNIGKGIITPEFLSKWGEVAGTQFVIWGIIVKNILPKIITEKTENTL